MRMRESASSGVESRGAFDGIGVGIVLQSKGIDTKGHLFKHCYL